MHMLPNSIIIVVFISHVTAIKGNSDLKPNLKLMQSIYPGTLVNSCNTNDHSSTQIILFRIYIYIRSCTFITLKHSHTFIKTSGIYYPEYYKNCKMTLPVSTDLR